MADNGQPKAPNDNDDGKDDGQMNNEFNFAAPAAPPTRGRKRRNTAEELLKKIVRQSAPSQQEQHQLNSHPFTQLACPADFVKNTISMMPGLEEDQREMLKQIVDIKAENTRNSEGRFVDLNGSMLWTLFGENIPSKSEPPILGQILNSFPQQHSLEPLITTEQMSDILRTEGLGSNCK